MLLESNGRTVQTKFLITFVTPMKFELKYFYLNLFPILFSNVFRIAATLIMSLLYVGMLLRYGNKVQFIPSLWIDFDNLKSDN